MSDDTSLIGVIRRSFFGSLPETAADICGGYLRRGSMQTTEIYTRADTSAKLERLESAAAPKLRYGLAVL
jgi:hypothetical protein